MKWEYTWTLAYSVDTVMAKLGNEGWELIAVYDSKAYFKRPKEDYGKEEAVKKAYSEEDTHQPQRCSTAGELYTAAYHNAVNEEW